MTKDEALNLALEALERMKQHSYLRLDYAEQAIVAIKEALTIEVATAPEAFYGFPHGAASASKVGGNDLTDGETSP